MVEASTRRGEASEHNIGMFTIRKPDGKHSDKYDVVRLQTFKVPTGTSNTEIRTMTVIALKYLFILIN